MKLLACLLILFPCGLAAQQAATGAGQVSGRVFCADTGQPGRFATVQLVSEHPEAGPVIDSTSGKNQDVENVMATAIKAMMKAGDLSAISGLDGTFSIDKVPPGTYYIVAQLAGYQSPLSQLSMMERMKADADAMKAVERTAEKVVVLPGQQAHMEIKLERGSSISGTIHYDDGSPTPGVAAVLMVQDKDGKWKELGGAGLIPSSTDDRGRFRICGVAAGKYAIKATLPTTQAVPGMGAGVSLHLGVGDGLVVYSSGAMREKDIKPVEVGTGDDVDGVDVIFPLDNLHAVSGSVLAKIDSHPVNGGSMLLEDSDGKTILRTASIETDGTFRFNYVPEGPYVVKAADAADKDLEGSEASNNVFRMLNAKVLKSYGQAEMPVTVKADLTGLTLMVPEQGTAPVAPSTPAAPASAAGTSAAGIGAAAGPQ